MHIFGHGFRIKDGAYSRALSRMLSISGARVKGRRQGSREVETVEIVEKRTSLFLPLIPLLFYPAKRNLSRRVALSVVFANDAAR